MEIRAIQQPTDESETRLKELKEIEKTRKLNPDEIAEEVALSLRRFWNCEC